MRVVIRRVLERAELKAVGRRPERGIRKGVTIRPKRGVRVGSCERHHVSIDSRSVTIGLATAEKRSAPSAGKA